ncbi:uncharacterized protein [Lolium perenne]|uniref:uncharacterized protein n=1 Tax=Lolium perenne TaxID=4522 RepID=UPI003A9900F0
MHCISSHVVPRGSCTTKSWEQGRELVHERRKFRRFIQSIYDFCIFSKEELQEDLRHIPVWGRGLYWRQCLLNIQKYPFASVCLGVFGGSVGDHPMDNLTSLYLNAPYYSVQLVFHWF